MGWFQMKRCSQRKTEKEEIVTCCKNRHYFANEAASAHNKLAAAHSSYTTCLIKTGAALANFAAQFPVTYIAPATNQPLLPPPFLRRSSIIEEEEENGLRIVGAFQDVHDHSDFAHKRGHLEESFAMILEKLLYWENKLCHEVKDAESKKIEYERKLVELNKLTERGTNSEALEKAKGIASHLRTTCIVDMEFIELTVSKINHLHNQQLYPSVLHGMTNMWKIIQIHHEQELKSVMPSTNLNIVQSAAEESGAEESGHNHDHNGTHKLLVVLQEWLLQFDILMNNQKKFIMALNDHLQMSEMFLSKNPRIQVLLQAWHDKLEKLPQEGVRTIIADFAAEIDRILQEQHKEMALKRKYEVTRNEYGRKFLQFKEWENKYEEKEKEKKKERQVLLVPHKVGHPSELLREKRRLVKLVKMKLDEEKQDYLRQCLSVREKSLSSLQNYLPKLFKAMSDFSLENFNMFSGLAV